MKTRFVILSILVFCLFFCGKCNDDDEQSFVIQNKSSQEIIIVYGAFRFVDIPGKKCIHKTDQLYWDRAIRPHSNKNIKYIAASILSLSTDTLYIEAFNRIDVDTMSCEEFDKKTPVKKLWALTQKDAEILDWTITYS